MAVSAGCGRVNYLRPRDAGGPPPDARSSRDANADVSVPSDPLVVLNTLPDGPGSLRVVLGYLNEHCAMLGPTTIGFDIPDTDAGLVTLAGGRRVWRIGGDLEKLPITCAGAVLDGTTQTSRHGDTNPATFGGLPTGEAHVPLSSIPGPEVELRGISLRIDAPDVTVRGLALRAIELRAARGLVTECVLGSEPDTLVPVPTELRTWGLFYGESCADTTVRGNVFLFADAPEAGYSGFSFRGGCDRATAEGNHFSGQGAGSVWDELHLNPATDHRVIHNYIDGTSWEWHIEWVGGTGGEIRDNTFVGPVRPYNVEAAMTTGNEMIP
ncbi:MAG: hypothetical protein K1X94_00960 [Sandaracinaceae bacterium]|nr:hypothetical protein [Sandaracinaceae bacterium]